MSIQVVDLQNEEVKELPTIEETKEEPKEDFDDDDDEIKNEVVEEQNNNEIPEPPKEQTQEAPPKPKRQTQKDRMQCPKCFKEMSVKSYKYSHEKNCGGKLSDRPVKHHAKPKAKTKTKPTPKPAPDVYYSDSEEEDVKPLSKPIKNQVLKPQPINPQTALAQHYQLLQQQLRQQKQDRYNNLCQSIFSSKSKKR